MTATIAGIGRYGLWLRDLGRALLVHGMPKGQMMAEAFKIGIKSLPILVIIAAFVGTNLALQGYNAFKPLGGQRLVGMFVALAGVRELAPIIAAAMIAAKAGTEMASQIGVMKIREQVDALEVMAVNPLAYLVAPRMIGILLMLPALTVIAIFVMLSAAYAVCIYQLGMNGHEFIQFAQESIEPIDFLYGALKAMFFGAIICTISCYFGFNCGKGPEGVGQATNRAVVTSSVICIAINYFVSELLYGGAF
jgi:phospholipid/cholesterol/gamma-HCH transport system permease protein